MTSTTLASNDTDSLPGPLSAAEVEALYRCYSQRVLQRSRRLLRDEALALDVRQEVFLKLLQRGAPVRDVSSQRAWLFTVTTHCCIDRIRQRRSATALASRLSADEQPPAPSLEEQASLRDVLSRLSPRQRHVAQLLTWDGLTQGEIAAQLGCSRQCVNRGVRAMRRLTQELSV